MTADGRAVMQAPPNRAPLLRARVLFAALLLTSANAQTTFTVPAAPPDCGSVVLLKCDRPQAADAQKQEARRRAESRRIDGATLEFERIIIEGDGERQSPESTLSRALSRPLLGPGEQTFAIGEGAQCTCLNVCPPPPFPCCSCTDRVGSRHATSPGWKPTN